MKGAFVPQPTRRTKAGCRPATPFHCRPENGFGLNPMGFHRDGEPSPAVIRGCIDRLIDDGAKWIKLSRTHPFVWPPPPPPSPAGFPRMRRSQRPDLFGAAVGLIQHLVPLREKIGPVADTPQMFHHHLAKGTYAAKNTLGRPEHFPHCLEDPLRIQQFKGLLDPRSPKGTGPPPPGFRGTKPRKSPGKPLAKRTILSPDRERTFGRKIRT